MNFLVVILFSILSFNLFAMTDVDIKNPTIKLPPPGMEVTAIFLKITNRSEKDLKIIKASGDFAETFELHTMEMNAGKMSMRPVASIDVKKNSSTELTSKGLHIMVFDLKKPLKEGEIHKLKLTLDDKTEMEINAIVRKNN